MELAAFAITDIVITLCLLVAGARVGITCLYRLDCGGYAGGTSPRTKLYLFSLVSFVELAPGVNTLPS